MVTLVQLWFRALTTRKSHAGVCLSIHIALFWGKGDAEETAHWGGPGHVDWKRVMIDILLIALQVQTAG